LRNSRNGSDEQYESNQRALHHFCPTTDMPYVESNVLMRKTTSPFFSFAGAAAVVASRGLRFTAEIVTFPSSVPSSSGPREPTTAPHTLSDGRTTMKAIRLPAAPRAAISSPTAFLRCSAPSVSRTAGYPGSGATADAP